MDYRFHYIYKLPWGKEGKVRWYTDFRRLRGWEHEKSAYRWPLKLRIIQGHTRNTFFQPLRRGGNLVKKPVHIEPNR
jgi:hypothetical protein